MPYSSHSSPRAEAIVILLQTLSLQLLTLDLRWTTTFDVSVTYDHEATLAYERKGKIRYNRRVLSEEYNFHVCPFLSFEL